MRQAISIGLMVVVYLAVAFLLVDNFWLSKCLPPALAVLVAWAAYQRLSKIAVGSTLFVLAVMLPIGLLVFGVSATDSVTENTKLLLGKLSILDVVYMFVPVCVGLAVAICLSYARRPNQPTPAS